MRERWEGQMEVASGANHHAENLVQNAKFGQVFFLQML